MVLYDESREARNKVEDEAILVGASVRVRKEERTSKFRVNFSVSPPEKRASKQRKPSVCSRQLDHDQPLLIAHYIFVHALCHPTVAKQATHLLASHQINAWVCRARPCGAVLCC